MAGINVKIGVTGISQFKRNIKVAQNSVKTLDQQLAINEKQFKATGDAEAYMQQKTELLKRQEGFIEFLRDFFEDSVLCFFVIDVMMNEPDVYGTPCPTASQERNV